ncbi:MAG TPA: hypothetical protein VJP80_07310 [Candidatus Saccharimonadales bacterium]|nr:hypothetical protein [Candidatus Saccharimonadales bacterium]
MCKESVLAVKNPKTNRTKKAITGGSLHQKRAAVKRARPLHKRVLLHPFTVMVLLCTGVLMVGMTIQGFAASYLVTATVPAPPVTHPAIITAPSAQMHVQKADVTVTGTCQAQSYATISVNSTLAGVAPCDDTSQTFSLQVTLSPGANQLQAQAYNLTNQPGPSSDPVVVYLDETSQTPSAPTSTPTTLQLATIEGGQYAQDNGIWQTSVNPTIAGYAPPFARVVVTFHSDVQTCITQADALGWWSCTLDNNLPIGLHHVDITATTSSGQTFTFPTFKIEVLASKTSILKPATSAAPRIAVDQAYQARRPGQTTEWHASISGGTTPYSVTVSWGDGSVDHLVRQDGSTFALTHTYTGADNKNYLITISVTDAKGMQGDVQLVAAINLVLANAASVLPAAHDPLSAVLGGVRQRLWLIWPAYIVVVLMAIGYYLGEREEYRRLALVAQPVYRRGRPRRK